MESCVIARYWATIGYGDSRMCVPIEVEANAGSTIPSHAEVEASLRNTISSNITIALTPWE